MGVDVFAKIVINLYGHINWKGDNMKCNTCGAVMYREWAYEGYFLYCTNPDCGNMVQVWEAI